VVKIKEALLERASSFINSFYSRKTGNFSVPVAFFERLLKFAVPFGNNS